MSTAPTLQDVPPYHLQHLISDVNELLGGSQERPDGGSSRRGAVEIRCAQALGTEIYVGCSDGSLLRYAFIESLGSSTDSYQLLTHQALPSGHAIEQIVLAPGVERALILCDHQIHFFTLPNLEPVQQIKPIRNVVTFALDDAQQRKLLPDSRLHQSLQSEPACVCVIKRNTIGVYSLRERLVFHKEIPLPKGATLARLSNKHLCVADNETYHIIDIETTSLISLMPLSQAADNIPVKPSITVITESEFLLLSWTGTSTLGVFITGTGDPVRGTLAWEAHPVALSCDYPYVPSVLSNGTIEVHSLETQSICHVLAPSGSFNPSTLETSYTGCVAPSGEWKQKLEADDFPLLEPETPNTSAIEEGRVSDTHLNAQSPPRRRDSLGAASTKKRRAMQPKAGVLAIGPGAIYALVTPTLIQQADALLANHKLKETSMLAEERRKKLAQSHGANGIEEQTEELHYVYQRLGYKCLSETLFEDAGNHLFRGNVDPRLLIRLFPALRGTLFSTSLTSLPVCSGLASEIRALGTVDTIIVTNLVKNYTPHLQPNTRSAPPTSELRKLLMVSAREMLSKYLRKWKNKVMYGGEPVIKVVSQVIDTVLVKLYAESEDTEELYSLIESSEDIVIDEVEETLVHTGQYNALIKIHRKRGNESKLLEIWSKLVDGEWTDEDIKNPLGEMVDLLSETRNRPLVQWWSLWLVKRDVTAGLKLFMSDDTRRGAKTDDGVFLAQVEAVSTEAGQQFLEYLILQKHSIVCEQDSSLHTRLAQVCLDRLVSALESETTLEYFRESAFEYSIQNSSTPFLTYLASTADASSSQAEHVRTRCRTALFLQGSALYDARVIRDKLKPWDEVLGLEVAILDGKLGNHIEALKALVHTLRDTASADAYCALGGCPVPPKVAQFVGERLDLQPWAALVIEGSNGRGGKAEVKAKENLEETRGLLLKVLLEVYMSGGEATESHAARLLNSQGGNLDVLNVLSLVPPAWSLRVVSSFLTRSLRRAVHERYDGEILKAMCLGQNLEVRDNAYLLVRAQGAVIEEPLPGTQPPPPPPDTSEVGAMEKKTTAVDAEGEKIEVAAVRLLEAEKEDVLRHEVRVDGGEIT